MSIVFDYETIGLDHNSPDFKNLFVGFSDLQLESTYPAWKGHVFQPNGICREGVRPYERWVAHNVKFDAKCLLKDGVRELPNLFDTQIAMKLLRGDLLSYKLEDLAHILYKDFPNYKYLVDFKKESYWEDLEKLRLYNFHDVTFTTQLYHLTNSALVSSGMLPLFNMIMDFVKELVYVEMKGIGIDVKELHRQGDILREEEVVFVQELKKYSETVNWTSPKQVSEYFGTKASDSFALKMLNKPDAELVLKFRHNQKMLSTYNEGVLKRLHGDIYFTDYDLKRTVTGRLSEALIQLIPRGSTSDFKRALVSKFDGGELLTVDWSSQELRLKAEDCGCEKLIEDLNTGKDIHAETLSRFSFLPDRTKAKNANFSVMYYGKGYTLAKNYGFSSDEAELFRADLLARYPGVEKDFDRKQSELFMNGYVTNLIGRRMYAKTAFQAINYPIQSLGTDLNKMMFAVCGKALREGGFESHLIFDKHDEVGVDIKSSEKEEVVHLIKLHYDRVGMYFEERFGKFLKLKYPYEMKIGKSLLEMSAV